MGMGYVYKCPTCGHEETYLIGVGFTTPTYRDEARKSILAGDYGAEAKAALEANPDAVVDVEWAMYQCPSCYRVENRHRVTASRPVIIRNHQFCDCGREMQRFRRGMKMICSSCREPMPETDEIGEILWD